MCNQHTFLAGPPGHVPDAAAALTAAAAHDSGRAPAAAVAATSPASPTATATTTTTNTTTTTTNTTSAQANKDALVKRLKHMLKMTLAVKTPITSTSTHAEQKSEAGSGPKVLSHGRIMSDHNNKMAPAFPSGLQNSQQVKADEANVLPGKPTCDDGQVVSKSITQGVSTSQSSPRMASSPRGTENEEPSLQLGQQPHNVEAGKTMIGAYRGCETMCFVDLQGMHASSTICLSVCVLAPCSGLFIEVYHVRYGLHRIHELRVFCIDLDEIHWMNIHTDSSSGCC